MWHVVRQSTGHVRFWASKKEAMIDHVYTCERTLIWVNPIADVTWVTISKYLLWRSSVFPLSHEEVRPENMGSQMVCDLSIHFLNYLLCFSYSQQGWKSVTPSQLKRDSFLTQILKQDPHVSNGRSGIG